jgi:cell fate regulator YaaT (PSP1 superfamily)
MELCLGNRPQQKASKNMSTVVLRETVLVRYGAIPEVARFRIATLEPLKRDSRVVVRTHRGIELGTLLQDVDDRYQRASPAEDSASVEILRAATEEDLRLGAQLRSDTESQFDAWRERITHWKLNLELVELEWLHDRHKLVLYVLNERGPDCTKLALQAAAAGLGIIEVQPVDAQGLIQLESSGGGCGSGGCGSGGCH